MKVNEIAARIHRDMVEDPANGYSWSPRWGEDGLGAKTLTIDGKKYTYERGSYDCSSSARTAWKTALKGTKWEHALDGATWTGNMRSVFEASGLFEWKPMSFIASPGDLYLDEDTHVAMCQSQVPDLMSEFCINENGEVYGGKVGDQTGKEAAVNPFRDNGFDGILHYNGKADATVAKQANNATVTKAKKPLYGIDVSSNQPERIVSMVPNDFAIVKMSGNPPKDGSGRPLKWNFVNPFAKQQASDAMKKHGLLGLYHFTYGKTAKTEADFFVKQVEALGYLGKAMLVIDYEDSALSLGRVWVYQFARRVEELTGYKPVIYASGSVIVSQDLASLGYPMWCASYSKVYEPIYGYDTSGCKIYRGCEGSILWQYTSEGYLDGHDDGLDCNVFYGTADDFKALMGPKGSAKPTNAAKPAASKTVKEPVRYRVSVDPLGVEWLDEMENLTDTGGSKDKFAGVTGKPMRWLAVNAKKYRVFTEKSGWLGWITRYDVDDLEDGCAGDGSPILGVEIADDSVRYSAHRMRTKALAGKWYASMRGSKQIDGKSTDHFAGDLANKIDAIRMKRV